MLKDEIEAIREANRKTENYFSDQGYLADEVDEKEWRKVKNEILREMEDDNVSG